MTHWVAKSNDSQDLFYVPADEAIARKVAADWGYPATAEEMTSAEVNAEILKRAKAASHR